jgi:hypothetical protein
MKFQFIKLIEDRSPDLVTPQIERCLESEAWKVWRVEDSVLAQGIGTSRSIINLSDRTKFLIRPVKASTEIAVEVEYQGTWVLSADAQNAQVQSRLEEVFARVRAELALSPEAEPSLALEQEESSEDRIEREAGRKEVARATNRAAVSAASVARPDAQRQGIAIRSLRSNALALTAQSIVTIERLVITIEKFFGKALSSSKKSFGKLLSSSRSSIPRRPLAAAAVLAVLIPCSIFWSLHSKANRTRSPAPGPPASAQQGTHAPDLQAGTPASPETAPDTAPKTSQDLVQPSTLAVPAPRETNVRRWLEAWAASQRTRDAKMQASFYASHVSPYLNQSAANWAAVYRSKQDAIHDRKGLWTFDIKDISIHQRDRNTVSVHLKKHVMAQAGSVLVSEEFIPSHLTLSRTGGVWHITGEQDLQ